MSREQYVRGKILCEVSLRKLVYDEMGNYQVRMLNNDKSGSKFIPGDDRAMLYRDASISCCLEQPSLHGLVAT